MDLRSIDWPTAAMTGVRSGSGVLMESASGRHSSRFGGVPTEQLRRFRAPAAAACRILGDAAVGQIALV